MVLVQVLLLLRRSTHTHTHTDDICLFRVGIGGVNILHLVGLRLNSCRNIDVGYNSSSECRTLHRNVKLVNFVKGVNVINILQVGMC